MADIDIQEKRGGSVWPWILGLLALVLVVWAVAEMMGGDDAEVVATEAEVLEPAPLPAPGMTGSGAMPAEVTQFEEQCATQSAAQDDMGMQHEFTNQCIRSMTAALDAVVQREQVNDTQLSEEFAAYRERADNLTENPQSTEHAAMVDDIFDDAASLIRSIEEAREATGQTLDRQADRVQEAADNVNASGTLLEQREAVGNFFREASAALRTLATQQG